jgi:uncharacterized membrane protein YfcA
MREVLAESALVAIIGGAVGTTVAVSLVAVMARVLDIPLAVAPSTVHLEPGASAASGIVAGWYPGPPRRPPRRDHRHAAE